MVLERISFHKESLNSGKWFSLSLLQQMGNLGSEVGRTLISHRSGDIQQFESAYARMDELFSMILADRRWSKGTIREICRVREVILDYLFGENQYGCNDQDLENYFLSFGIMANEERRKTREIERQKGITSSIQGFTLIELIVVITILSILSTIAFLSFQGFSSSARDSGRISDIGSIAKTFELYQINAGSYPMPDNSFSVTYSGGVIWNQGTVGSGVIQKSYSVAKGGVSKTPTDPLSNTEYTYSSLAQGRAYEILGKLEEDPSITFKQIPGVDIAYAASSNPTTAYVKSNYNGLVAKTTAGGIIYVLAIPSLISNTGSAGIPLTIESGVLSGTLLQNNSSLSGISFNPSTVVFSGAALPTNDSASEITNLVSAIKTTYSASALASQSTITSFLNTPPAQMVTVGCTIIKNLGGKCSNVNITTFFLSSNSVTIGTPVTISDTCTTHPTSYTSSNTAVATISGTNITTLTAGTTTITPVGGNCSDSLGKILTVTVVPVPDWAAIDTNCSQSNITIGSQTWAGCNSTIGSIAIDYNTTVCYNSWSPGSQIVCPTPPVGKTKSTMTDGSSNIYGALYQWDTMNSNSCFATGIATSNTICPCKGGYHIPTQAEWDTLEVALGCTTGKRTGNSTGWECTGVDDTINGLGWTSTNPNSLKNILGLTLAGNGFNGGSFDFRGITGFYYTSSFLDAASVWKRELTYSSSSIYRMWTNKTQDYSIRCIKD